MDSDLNIFLNALRDAINNDPNQFNRAKNDSMYDAFRPQVDALLDEMYQEVKTNAEKENRYLDYATLKMKRWFDSEYSDPENIQKYEELLSNIHNAKEKLKNRNYVSHVNAVNIMNEAKKIKDEIHASIKNNLDSMENELNHNITILKNDEYKDELIRKKKTGLYKRIIIAWGLLIATAYACSTASNEDIQGLWIILGLSLSFAALVRFLDKSSEIIGAVVLGFIATFVTSVIFLVIDFLFGEQIVFLILIIIVLIVWPFILQDKDIKSKLSKLENNKKSINERIIFLNQKIQIAEEAILLQSPKKADPTDMMKLLVKSTSSNIDDRLEAVLEIEQQTDSLLNSYKRALENSKKK